MQTLVTYKSVVQYMYSLRNTVTSTVTSTADFVLHVLSLAINQYH